ncbi:MAG: hypothetical protein ACI8TX_002164 [Hyphomicrobiaceae bacterium]
MWGLFVAPHAEARIEFSGSQRELPSRSFRSQKQPGVIQAVPGEFVLVFRGNEFEEPFSNGIFGRRFDEDGLPLGPEKEISVPFGDIDEPSDLYAHIVARPSGGFVIAWTEVGRSSDGNDDAVVVRHVDKKLNTVAASRVVNTTSGWCPGSGEYRCSGRWFLPDRMGWS